MTVTAYMALAWIAPVLVLVPILRTGAVASLAAVVVASDTAKLMYAVFPLVFMMFAVTITRTVVPVVGVTDGLVPGLPLRVAV